jgi:signal transduction histidine kinase
MVVMVIAILLFGIQAGAAETIVFLVGLAILAALLGGITYWTQKTLADDLKEIGQGLEKIVLENDLDRMPQPRLAELSGLAQDMDTIAASVRENYRLLTQERDRLQAVLENISVGIIVVGKDLKTRMINPVAEKILGTSEEYALGRTFTEIHHTSSIDMAIEKARLGRASPRK